jgi:hypothetical protein
MIDLARETYPDLRFEVGRMLREPREEERYRRG